MTIFLRRALGGVLLALVLSYAAYGGTDLPWALRDHYEFPFENGRLNYAADNADWGVTIQGLGDVIPAVRFSVTLADGTVIRNDALEPGKPSREKVADPLGDATDYSVLFAPNAGLTVRHRIRAYKDRSFFLIKLEVQNAGDKPTLVANINPAVLGPEGIALLDNKTDFAARPLAFRGSRPVIDSAAPAALLFFNDRAKGLTLAFGVLAQGKAISGGVFEQTGRIWRGEMGSRFEPPVRLAPGATLEADPVWFSFATVPAGACDSLYAWALATVNGNQTAASAPRTWIAMDENTSPDAYIENARAWAAAGVRYALAPNGVGGQSKRPEPVSIAKELDALGMVMGLEIDPLAAPQGNRKWTRQDSNGLCWLNLLEPAALTYGKSQIRKMAAGYGFVVVRPSRIPDEVLRQLNVTRAEAEATALRMAQAALPDSPVIPCAAATVSQDIDLWLAAAGCAGRLQGNGLDVGAIRFDTQGTAAIEENLAFAMTLFPGSVELVGKPAPGGHKYVAQALARPPRPLRPVDAARPSPKVWQVPASYATNGAQGDTVVVFPGAGTWTSSDVEMPRGASARLWHAPGGAFTRLGATPTDMNEKIAVYGSEPIRPHPVFLGTADADGLVLHGVERCAWDGASGVLSGVFAGAHASRAKAYVSVPPPWEFRAGVAGEKRVIAKETASLLEFSVPGGQQTPFQLRFRPR